jgi:hypothetical protein
MKKEYLILAVIIVLLGGYLFLRYTDLARYEMPALETASAESITRVALTSYGETVELIRTDNGWQIGDHAYPADPSKAKEILSVLEGLKLSALVSESGAYSTYDLTDGQKIGVQAWAGDRRVRNFAVGKTAATYRHTFVRIGDDPNVYHAEGNFRKSFDHRIDDLRDKTALSFTTAEITGIDILSDGNFLSLSLAPPPAETTDTDAPESRLDDLRRIPCG